MAYDEDLADRLREATSDVDGLTEKRMFGGLAFLVRGNMAVAASGKGDLMLRVDPEQSEELVDEVQVRRMEMRGKQMDGWLRIDLAALEEDEVLRRWVGIGVRYASALPPK